MKTIKVLIGPSGAGKTTFATNFIKENPSYCRVNLDDIRRNLFGYDLEVYVNRSDYKHCESLVAECQHNLILNCLNNRRNVIIDSTNLHIKDIQSILRCYNHLADIEFEIIDTTHKQALENLKKREGDNYRVDYLATHFLEFERVKKEFNDGVYQKFYPMLNVKYTNDDTLPPVIICDLDGTLSLFDRTTKNPYHRDFENDVINQPICDILHSQMKSGTKIIFFSGRRENYLEQTQMFLNRCGFTPDDYTLIMRMDGDNRSDDLVKLTFFDEHIKDKYHVKYVFDDRLQVLENVWSKLGVFTFNVNQGNVRF